MKKFLAMTKAVCSFIIKQILAPVAVALLIELIRTHIGMGG